ncbi:MAG: LysM peptidoglycan-binding domain-containing protein [Nibricoccus sp.]
MNLKHLAIWIALAVVASTGLRAAVEFVGVSTENAETKVALVETSTGATKWVKPGEQFGGYTLASYDETEKSILLTKDGTELRIKLKEAKVTAPASENTATESSAPPSEYILKPGDTASRVAKNAGLSVADLQALNPGVNWAKLHVGQKIRVK